jgi:hypothetical protein
MFSSLDVQITLSVVFDGDKVTLTVWVAGLVSSKYSAKTSNVNPVQGILSTGFNPAK